MKYFAPKSLEELKDLFLSNHDLNILAGGTDVLPRWQDNPSLKPDVLVDIKKIPELIGIKESETDIKIGALTTVQDLKKSDIIKKHFSSIYEATCQFAGVQIRHRATIAGNICNASPAGDLLPGLYVHNAVIQISGLKGERVVPIHQFITGVGKTILESDEIVVGIVIPKSSIKSLFYKLGLRQSMAISVVNFAIAYEIDENNNWKSLQIAAGSVAPTVIYLKTFTDALFSGRDVDESIQLVDDEISPIDDIRATASYRSKVIKNVLMHIIKEIYVR